MAKKDIDPSQPMMRNREKEVTSEIFYKKIPDMIQALQEIARYGSDVRINFNTVPGYDGDTEICVFASWQDLETKEEVEKRLRFEKERLDSERKLYESLKKKFEPAVDKKTKKP